MEQQETIEGVVESVIFEAEAGSFCVFRFRPDGGLTATATANCPAPMVGEQVRLCGTWMRHAKFGEQFKATSLQRVAPTGVEGILRFLSSGAVKGVGPAMARRLVDRFGCDALEVIARAPQRLQEVEGIGRKKAREIHESYSAQDELRELMLFLETHGVSGAYAGKLFERYGSFAQEVLEKDPYRIAREVDGIGFRTADQIAASLGTERNDARRIAAGLDYALLQISGAGHCCAPEAALVDEAARLIGAPRAEVAEVLQRQLKARRICAEDAGNALLLYPPHLYRAERSVAERLLYLKDKALALKACDAAEEVRAWEAETGVALAQKQRLAVESALQHGVLVITGGPGTGKTTVVQSIIAVLGKQGLKILLGAPTGRAAKRLSEATGRKARTVHRMLESTGPAEGAPIFARGEEEPLEADLIILDEVSMMDIVLMRYFLEAVSAGCRVILVGDADQLPAVGPGAVLKDILRSETVPAVRLTEVFRQAGKSMIVLNAHAINRGQLPDLSVGAEFEFREIADSGAVAREIVSLCTQELAAAGLDVLREVQVLSPMHRLDCGVENLNRMLQSALNPPGADKAEIAQGGRVFRQGDKIMQMRNNYEKNVFNGDIGFVLEVEANRIAVRYPEADVSYEKAELLDLNLAYAMSVHKSQGSEYPVVLMPLVPGHRVMLQRNLLYTAITRAKRRVILLGAKAALHTAIANDRTHRRYSLLAERLRRQGDDWDES